MLGPTLPPPAAAALSPRGNLLLIPVDINPIPMLNKDCRKLFYHLFTNILLGTASKAVALAPAPASETTLPLTPPSPPVQIMAPPTTTGIRPVLYPSASMPSHIAPPISLLLFISIMVLKCY